MNEIETRQDITFSEDEITFLFSTLVLLSQQNRQYWLKASGFAIVTANGINRLTTRQYAWAKSIRSALDSIKETVGLDPTSFLTSRLAARTADIGRWI